MFNRFTSLSYLVQGGIGATLLKQGLLDANSSATTRRVTGAHGYS